MLTKETDLPPPNSDAAITARLLGEVRDLVRELHPAPCRSPEVRLESSLDLDLGLDSLSRAELLARLDKAFRVRLPEQLLGEAETPADVLHALLAVRVETGEAPPPQGPPTVTAAAEAPPLEADTLQAALDWHLTRCPDRPHIILDAGDREQTITYRRFAEESAAIACGLREWGLEPAERVAIMLPTEAAFFYVFFGTLLAGGIPVPIYPPVRKSQIEDHMRRQASILKSAGAAILVTEPETRAVGGLLRSLVDTLRDVRSPAMLRAAGGDGLATRASAQESALIQYTSGSTGVPKGVVLTHENILANIRAIGSAMRIDARDVIVSWLPLYHDMGLIGAWLGSLVFAAPTVILPPQSFLARPERWLWAIHRHRGTLSASPNFGFELCTRRIADEDIRDLDLSSLRMVVNGAEPVSAQTVRRFTDRFAGFGFRREAMAPVYGLAEAAVGLAFPPPGRAPIIDCIRRDELSRGGRVVPAATDDVNAVEFVACGQPLKGYDMRVVDAGGRALGEHREGRLQFRGPSATQGYFGNEAETRKLFDGDWLETGDLGYLANGDVYITGRRKDLIIRAGRNIYPGEVEECVGDVAGVRKGCVAAFGSHDPDGGTERVIVLAETREREPAELDGLRRRVHAAATQVLETPPDDIVLAPPHTVLKTSSGKIRRSACKELYEQGLVGARSRSAWLQLVRLSLAGLPTRTRRLVRGLVAWLYAGYWWTVAGASLAVTWTLVLFLPRQRWRWATLHHVARVAFWLTGIRLTREGSRSTPTAHAILVANHASYLDGMVLAATLPGEMLFAAKKELEHQFFAGTPLRRIDTIFVERFDPRQSVEHTRTLVARAREGRRLMVFPEGTMSPGAGLLGFRLGAFQAAVQAGVPVVSIAIRGTRAILGGDRRFPRRGAVSVHIADPLQPEGADFSAAVRPRDAARAVILGHCGEPDLVGTAGGGSAVSWSAPNLG